MAPKEKKKHKKKHKSSRKYEEIHELSHYLDDRLKLMKEVVKIMKPKKIKSMAPEFLKNVKFDDLMFLLMDELLGISKKRLKYIFSGKSDDVASSSCTDSEEEEKKVKQPPKPADDVISLSDITSDEDDDIVFCNEAKVKDEVKNKHIKKEKGRKIRKTSKKHEASTETPTTEKEKLMSVLELLELQARARAIRSQLALETKVDKTEETDERETKDDSDPEAVIIQSPKKDEIVISSSESEGEEGSRKKQKTGDVGGDSGNPKSWEAKPSSSIMQNSIICGNRKKQKIKIIRDRTVVPPVNSVNKEGDCVEESNKNTTENVETNSTECNNRSNKEEEREETSVTEAVVETSEQKDKSDVGKETVEKRNSYYDNEHSDNEPDIIVINLDDSDDLGCE